MERRSLLDDGVVTPTRELANVFDDEFEVEDFDGVVDGFRPSDHDRETSMRRSMEDHIQPTRTMSLRSEARPVSFTTTSTPSAVSRNSTRKSRSQPNPFASPEDEERTPSLLSFEPDLARRSVSSASSQNFARTSSPRFGPGPSHPYGMYPQGTVQRTSSIATQSTVRASQGQPATQGGPQHPYTLYPQGVNEDDDEETTLQDAVPVGFPGLGRSYQRRVGPDGEEQDMIGEDGHAEQLPPYTRYPEDGPEKMPLLGVPAPPTALHSRAPVAGTDPTMALMHDPIRPAQTPQPQSMTDASTLRGSRPASLANIESMNSRSAQNSLLSNKSWNEKSWKEKRKTKVCGIPFWWLILGVCVASFITAVLAGVIGGFLAHEKQNTQKALDAASTRFYDASAIATPATGPPTGTYRLPLSTPQETQAACLTVANQQPAWSCDLAGQPAQGITVNIPAGGNETGAYIFYGADDDQLCYGAQQSLMQTTWAPFHAVQDNDAPGDGPAFYFQQFYDKVVVVPENALPVPNQSNNKEKRQAIQLDQGWLHRKQIAQPGERPWFCVWNNTMMEGFIYVQQQVASSYVLTSMTATSTSNATAATATTATTTTSPARGSPTSIITTTVTGASSTETFTGPAEKISAWSSYVASHQAAQTDGAGAGAGDDDGNGGGHRKRQIDDDDAAAPLAELQTYPYIVKIEERRLEGNTVNPYCQQYQILDNGDYNWVADDNGDAIMIQLQEDDPSYAAYQSAGVAGSSKINSRGIVPGGCHCQWMSGQAT
ncbi:hypothetical protein LTR10_006382 [Elasticomyces elasticus]|nr:hypothetical protein LTR10_006382 [Elasticomyces elasticus]KAK4966571.1 hypothetical protein LTR42_010882 [Elasticomyces elasticus]